MKNGCLRLLMGLMILALVIGFTGEIGYANNLKGCSCSAAGKCHSNTKCANTNRSCICVHQANNQVILTKYTIPVLVFTGYLANNLDYSYFYLSVKDIFHPPKV
jgi:hypothetical protein